MARRKPPGLITMTKTDDPIEKRVGTVGRPLPGIEVKIIDPGSGESLGDGCSGELCCRGHDVMLGYCNMPEATSQAIDAEGWLHTGDLALRQPDGYFRVTGRIKDMIIRGTMKTHVAAKLKNCFTGIRRWSRHRSWACPIGSSAKRSWRGSSCGRASRLAWTKFAVSAASTWRNSRLPAPDRGIRGKLPHDGHRKDPKVQHPPASDQRVGVADWAQDIETA